MGEQTNGAPATMDGSVDVWAELFGLVKQLESTVEQSLHAFTAETSEKVGHREQLYPPSEHPSVALSHTS